MRFLFVVALAIVTGSVFFCLYAEPVPGGGIGDGGPARNATLYGRVPGRNLSNCSRLGRLTNFVGGEFSGGCRFRRLRFDVEVRPGIELRRLRTLIQEE
jgi:hypothetical protein